MKEIERKFLLKEYIDITTIPCHRAQHITDIYLNDNIRLRDIDNSNNHILTLKTGTGKVRNEFEWLILKDITLFRDMAKLVKTRLSTLFDGITFELNVFENILYQNNPLILVEVELQDINQKIQLPDWVGREVTEDEKFYGYNLYKLLTYKDFTVK